jgi:hypothetical protein
MFFFDPIAEGRFDEEFCRQRDRREQPSARGSLKPCKNGVLRIDEMLVAIVTEMEQTAERFRRERQLLDSLGRYYRLDVLRG